MNTENIDPKLWELISSKDYALLNDNEKAYVKAFVSEEEYANWRKMHSFSIKSYEEEFETYTFNAGGLKNKLDKHFVKNNDSTVISIWSRAIPLWQVAAMWVCLLLGMGWYVVGLKTESQEPLIAKIDTIFVPVASMPMHDTVYLKIRDTKTRLSVDTSSPQMITPDQMYVEDERMIEKSWSNIERELNSTKTQGKSTNEDTISGKFMIGVL